MSGDLPVTHSLGLVSCQAIIVSCILALMSKISPSPKGVSFFFWQLQRLRVCVCMSSSNWDEHLAFRVRHSSPIPIQIPVPWHTYDIWLPLVRKYLLSKHNHSLRPPSTAQFAFLHARVAIFLCPKRFSICMCECVRMFR